MHLCTLYMVHRTVLHNGGYNGIINGVYNGIRNGVINGMHNGVIVYAAVFVHKIYTAAQYNYFIIFPIIQREVNLGAAVWTPLIRCQTTGRCTVWAPFPNLSFFFEL